ncbi:VIT domain-containing protein [Erythrobacter sp. Alg231-14]|uniref:VIT domain-containing protein n=1 Tax=Erythrobacter sp. Alg231-14 TaxID=1922225 RepID=UPI000D562973
MKTLTRLIAILALTLLPAAAVSSPTNSANPSVRALINGIENGAEQPDITVSEFSVTIDQNGTMAEVEIDALLTNPSNNQVEARVAMQLPRDAVLTGYKLDIEGVMIPGSLIDQPKAQQIYEDEVRGTVDPGLAEISSRNEFSTRIYPILPNNSRRISLTFVTPIDTAEGLSIPLEIDGDVGSFRLSATANGVAEAPTITLSGLDPVQMTREGQSYVSAPYVLADTQLSGSLQLSGVDPISEAVASRHENGDVFFTISDDYTAVDLSEDPPESVRVYWDVSRSRADALVETERAVLTQFLNDTAPNSVEVITFSSATPKLTRFTGAQIDDLDAFLGSQIYRGATSFANVSTATRGDADLCILFSDGDASLNLSERFNVDCPLIAIASGANVNAQRLNLIAQDNGGKALFMDAQNSQDILSQMRTLPVGIVSIRDRGGNRLQYRALTAANGRWSVVGKLGEWDEVTVRLSGTRRNERRRTYRINTRNADGHNAAGALWASQEVNRLSDNPVDRDAMRVLAERFQVASPTMAFLVLEQPDQYLAADIEPPSGFGDQWLKQYQTQKYAREQERSNAREERLSFVVSEWEETKDWWNRKFDQDAVIQRVQQSDVQSLPVAVSEAATDAAAEAEPRSPPLLAPSPPPPPPPPGEYGGYYGDGDEDTIVVTGTRRAVSNLDAASPIAVVGADIGLQEAQAESGLVTTGNRANGAAPGNALQVDLANVLNDRPYLQALDAAKPEQLLEVLSQQEEKYGSAPGYYLDVAEWFRLKGDDELARQLVLSALDLRTSDDETLLIVAFRLERDGDFDTAIELLETLNARIEYRTQPKRILALTLAARARQSEGAQRKDDLERAFELLSEVILAPTDGRYEGLETVALMEINSLIPLIEAAGGSWSLDPRLIATLDTDIRVVVEWTSADADLDLHILEPSSENVFYGNQRSQLGGKLSNDMTSGYGPEEYVMRNAFTGGYEISVHGFSGDRINPNGPGRAMVRLIRNFARADQSEQLIDAEVGFDRSNRDENDRTIATIEVEN